MVIIERIPSASADALTGKERDTLALTWEGRRWCRRKVTTAAGREIALALPTGTVLALGGVVWIDTDWYLEVEGAAEAVIEVHPRTHQEGLRIAFEVGNRHFSVAAEGDALLVPDDTAMVHLLDRLGATWARRQAVYTPMGFGHTHTPSHDHEHGDEHAHAHGHPHEH